MTKTTQTPTRPEQESTARTCERTPSATAAEDAPAVRLFGARVRGRHRRPRPRRVLLAVGGLALAAGALSVVHTIPGPGSGVPGTAEAEPREDAGGGVSDGATHTAATVPAALGASPSATSAMGGMSATPTPDTAHATAPATHPAKPAPGTSTTPGAPDTTTIPEAPNPPAPSTTAPRPPATTPAAPPPGHSTPPPSSTPPPGEPGLCVPIVGLCVGPLGR